MIEGVKLDETDRQLRPVDLAYKILKQIRAPIHYRDLLDAVIDFKGLDGQDRDRFRARLYTEINLDPRFVHKGGGIWWLTEFQPKPAVQVVKEPAARPPRNDIGESLSGSMEILDDSQESPLRDFKDFGEDDWAANSED